MKIPKAKILKYAAMGIIAAFIATFFFKKEKQQGHPRDYAEIAAEKIIRAATEYNSISFYVDGDTLSGFHYELIEAFARDHGWKAAIIPEMSFDKRLEGLATGEFDVIAYGILATSELKDSLLLTTPIVLNKQVLVQRKAISPTDSLFVKSQLDLAGKTLHLSLIHILPSIPEMTVLLSSPDVTKTDANGLFPARTSLYAAVI